MDDLPAAAGVARRMLYNQLASRSPGGGPQGVSSVLWGTNTWSGNDSFGSRAVKLSISICPSGLLQIADMVESADSHRTG